MGAGPGGRWAVADFLSRYLLGLIVLSYVLAAWCRGGLWIKEAKLVDTPSPLGRVEVTPPKVLLAVLLACAGLRVKPGRIGEVLRRPTTVLAGLATNLTAPVVFLAALAPLTRFWPKPDEAALVLVGLALVSAMPIAGSSTGWAQAADGDMATSLGLVLGSTLISPLTSPVTLRILGAVAPGRHGAQIQQLADPRTGSFLAAWVLLPAALGLAARWALGEARAAQVEPRLKVVAPLTLLLLCYGNAADCLPATVRHPDWPYLATILTFVAGLCTLTFAAGYAVGRALNAGRGERVALLFGLGMNNNGTGLTLAALMFDHQPRLLLPIILYNLAQHLAAGCVAARLARADRLGHPRPRPGTRVRLAQPCRLAPSVSSAHAAACGTRASPQPDSSATNAPPSGPVGAGSSHSTGSGTARTRPPARKMDMLTSSCPTRPRRGRRAARRPRWRTARGCRTAGSSPCLRGSWRSIDHHDQRSAGGASIQSTIAPSRITA